MSFLTDYLVDQLDLLLVQLILQLHCLQSVFLQQLSHRHLTGIRVRQRHLFRNSNYTIDHRTKHI